MAIKWGSTTVTVVKWGSTTCTAVYWGSTKVFPDAYNLTVAINSCTSADSSITTRVNNVHIGTISGKITSATYSVSAGSKVEPTFYVKDQWGYASITGASWTKTPTIGYSSQDSGRFTMPSGAVSILMWGESGD